MSAPRPMFCAATLVLFAVTGCRSAMVDATIRNNTPTEIDLLEVQYPSASFGVQILAPGADFHYRFKILGNGGLVLSYTDGKRVEHTAKGPDLHEGEQGRLGITISSSTVEWSPVPARPPH